MRGRAAQPQPAGGLGHRGQHRQVEQLRHLALVADARPQLVPGERGLILRIDADPGITRRLMELGLVPGTVVELVRTAPLGDPLELAVRGLHLSLRRSEAGHIHVAQHG